MADTSITSKKDCFREECACCAITEAYVGIRLKKCSKCKLVSYCGKECQKQHWVKGGHKQMCLSPGERKFAIPVNTETSTPAKICLICRSDLDFENQTEPLMTLPCGHCFHSKCVVSMEDLCLHKVCPLCQMPLGHDAIRSVRLNEEANTIWSECLFSFKTRTGHSMDCIGHSCHVLNEDDEAALKESVNLHTQAAHLGSAGSAQILSMIYERGLGNAIPKDFKLAEYWMECASSYPNSKKHFCHAMMYVTGGFGIDANIEKGKRMLRIIALQGDSQAQCILGTLQRDGDTVIEREEGLRFLKMSALQGEKSAICDLGQVMYEGKLLPRSYKEAFMLFKEAAEQGCIPAMYFLSGCYLRGHGVHQNSDLAETWFINAEAHGDHEIRIYTNKWFADFDI